MEYRLKTSYLGQQWKGAQKHSLLQFKVILSFLLPVYSCRFLFPVILMHVQLLAAWVNYVFLPVFHMLWLNFICQNFLSPSEIFVLIDWFFLHACTSMQVKHFHLTQHFPLNLKFKIKYVWV